MNAAYKAKLKKNIGKYAWFKIFTKRVYLPLIAIAAFGIGSVLWIFTLLSSKTVLPAIK